MEYVLLAKEEVNRQIVIVDREGAAGHGGRRIRCTSNETCQN
jgi:hypothetical protein